MKQKLDVDRLTDFQRVFIQSRVNGAKYSDDLPVTRWAWPKGWLQARMAIVKEREVNGDNGSMPEV